MSNSSGYYICGYAGSGKTFVANYLKKTYGCITTKWARPVYSIATELCGMKHKDRALLQLIGTDVGRELISQDIWVERFKQDQQIAEEVYKRLGKTVSFVSDDTRFKNEHKVLKEMGWVGIFLEVPEQLRLKRLEGRDGTAQIQTLSHVSETSLDEFKNELIKVDASGTLEQLYENIEQTLEHVRKERNEVRSN